MTTGIFLFLIDFSASITAFNSILLLVVSLSNPDITFFCLIQQNSGKPAGSGVAAASAVGKNDYFIF